VVLRVESVHGSKCRLPIVSSITVDFPDNPEIRGKVLKAPPYEVHRP